MLGTIVNALAIIMGGIKSENIILVIGSVVLGSIIGEVIGIENKLDN
ncbi:hypothetical protein ACR77J_11130 [Tissierella praeacuta]